MSAIMIAQSPPNPSPRGDTLCPIFDVSAVPFSSPYEELTEVAASITLPMLHNWTNANIDVSSPSIYLLRAIQTAGQTSPYQVNATDAPHIYATFKLKTSVQEAIVTYTVTLNKAGCPSDTKTVTIHIHR